MTNSNGINFSNALLAPLGAVGLLLKPRQKNLLQPDKPDEVTIRSADERAQAAAEAQAQATAATPIPGVRPANFIKSNIQRVNRQEERTDNQSVSSDAPQSTSTSSDSDAGED